MATRIDPTFTAIDRDRIAYVAFAASLNKTDGRKAAQEKGREVTQTDEDAHEAASGVGAMDGLIGAMPKLLRNGDATLGDLIARSRRNRPTLK